MALATHPSPEILAAFARGDLPQTDLASVADHVARCAVCCAIVARAPEDTLAGLARAAVTAPTPAPAAVLPALPATKPDLSIPPELASHPRYKLLKEIGAGGMGVVYKAEHLILGRVVALKVMAPHLAAKAGAPARFRKEMRLAAQLNHPHIVQTHDADEAGGLLFLVMEYVEGASLDRVVAKKGPLPVPMACSFARQAALGLQHAHDKGMVHRDIKPHNLMVTKKAQVKVMDFGLARFARTDIEGDDPAAPVRVPFGGGRVVSDPMTNPNLLLGTPDYLSPEQAKNSHTVGSRSDLYSLGCTLHFLLTGKPPFADSSTLIDKLLAHTEEPPPDVRAVRPDVPDALAEVLAKLLAKDPAARYPTASDAAAALYPFTRIPEAVPVDDDRYAGFEVIDAVVIPPPAATVVTPIPGAATPADVPAPVAPAAFDFDTAPVSPGPTAVDEETPRKAKRAKKAGRSAKAVPWWKHTWAKVGAAVVLFGLVVAIATATRGKKPDGPPPGGDNAKIGGNANPGPNTPHPRAQPKPVKERKVLYVLPSEGVWLDDYQPVRTRLEKSPGVRVVTASGQGGSAKAGDENGVRDSIPVDVKLEADLDVSGYSAIVFCGLKVEEYIGFGRSSHAASRVLDKMQKAGKPVAAICVGQKALAAHDVLTNRRAAWNKQTEDHFRSWKKIDFVYERVVTDGNVITAGTPKDAEPFAAALLAAMGGE